jgi:hypothetical protein
MPEESIEEVEEVEEKPEPEPEPDKKQEVVLFLRQEMAKLRASNPQADVLIVSATDDSERAVMDEMARDGELGCTADGEYSYHEEFDETHSPANVLWTNRDNAEGVLGKPDKDSKDWW